MKKHRHNKIIELINSLPIETQEEMQAALLNVGFNVTQATVSRDIKQLGLIKAQDKNGRYRYVTSRTDGSSETNYLILISSIINIEYALNNVVIKCNSGMASSVCVAVDEMFGDMMLGSLAGDDTIIIVTSSEADSLELTECLNNLL